VSWTDRTAISRDEPDDEPREYVHQTVKVIRGREASKVAEMQDLGWELLSQNHGTLRTELAFRKVKPKTFVSHLHRLASRGYAAFRQLAPATQRRVFAIVGCAIAVLAVVAVAASMMAGGDVPAPSSAAAPQKTAAAPEASSETPSRSETETGTSSPEYVYAGPAYEVVVADEYIGPAGLKQIWVYVAKLDTSTTAYKDQVKLIITDLAHKEGTASFLVEVVTDKEIAEAEAFSTQQDFVEEHGDDYFLKDIPKKEKAGYVAAYAGGFDHDAGEASDDAFEVTWMIASDNPEFENWKPDVGD
jgi:hypothetical protein